MHYASLFAWALASFVLVDGLSISPRQQFQSSLSSSTVATTFTQITQTYAYLTTYFEETRTQLQMASSFTQVAYILEQFSTRMSQVIQPISGGCDCGADGADYAYFQQKVSMWFSELQTITQIVNQRFPGNYQQLSQTFTQISYHMEVAFGVAYSTGLNIDSIVQRATQRPNINTGLLSRFNINTSRLINVSAAVNSQTGPFRTHRPKGSRFATPSTFGGHRNVNPSTPFTNPSHSPLKIPATPSYSGHQPPHQSPGSTFAPHFNTFSTHQIPSVTADHRSPGTHHERVTPLNYPNPGTSLLINSPLGNPGPASEVDKLIIYGGTNAAPERPNPANGRTRRTAHE